MPIESSNHAWRPLAAGMLLIGNGVAALAAGPSGSLWSGEPSAAPEAGLTVTAGPLTFSERRLLHGYTYAYGIAAADPLQLFLDDRAIESRRGRVSSA